MPYTPSNDLDVFAEDADLTHIGVLDQTADPAATSDGVQTTPQPGQASEAAETPDAQKTTDDWRQLLEDATDPLAALSRLAQHVSREDLLRNPTLAGIVGDSADKLERKRAADRQRESEEAAIAAARAERERKLDQAAEEEDLLTLGELTLEERKAAREARARDEEAARQSQTATDLFAPAAKAPLDKYVDAQTPAVKAEIQKLAADPERYAGLSWEAGYQKWLDDVVTIMAESRRPEWDKNTRESIRKDELGRAESEEPDANPEVGNSGTPNTSDLISQAVWEQNRGSGAWRMQNLDRIKRSVAAGSIHD